MIENQQDLITELQKHSGFSDSIDLSQLKDQILKNKPNPQWIIKDSKIDNDINEIIKELKLRNYSAHKNINSSKVLEGVLNQAFPKKRKKKVDKDGKEEEVNPRKILEGCNLKEKLEHQKESTLEFSFIKKCCTIVVHQQIKCENNKIFNNLAKHPEFSECFTTGDKGKLKIDPSNIVARDTQSAKHTFNERCYLLNIIKVQFKKLFDPDKYEGQDPGFDPYYDLKDAIKTIYGAVFTDNAYKIEKRLQLAKENGALREDGEYTKEYKIKCQPENHPEKNKGEKVSDFKMRLPDGEFLPDEESIRYFFIGETLHYISNLNRKSNKRREKKLTTTHIDKLNSYKNKISGVLELEYEDFENFIIKQFYPNVTMDTESKGSIKVYNLSYSLPNEKTIKARIKKPKSPGIKSTEHAAAIQEGVTIYWRENIKPETNYYYKDDEEEDMFNDTIASSETSERIKETDEEYKSIKVKLIEKLSGDKKACVHYLTALHSDREADEAEKFKKTMDSEELKKWKRKCLKTLRSKAKDPQLTKLFKEVTSD